LIDLPFFIRAAVVRQRPFLLHTHVSPSDISELAGHFALAGDLVQVSEIHAGHINSTWKLLCENSSGPGSYVLQKINSHVFPDPHAVMGNVERVLNHLANQPGSDGKRHLHLIPTHQGGSCMMAPDGEVWRCYNFIEGCVTYDVVENPRQAWQAAYAFGAFQRQLSDLPAASLVETIPYFHDTPRRYRQLLEMAERDPHGRLNEVRPEMDFIAARSSTLGVVVDGLSSGSIPLRITHNDTKINNVMMDAATDEAVCVIDLDTVMPGSVLYDFGDLVRTAVSPASEDEVDLSKVVVRPEILRALHEGYLEATGDILTAREKELLPVAGPLIATELAIRFLTDYLDGDLYFKTKRPRQNLDRCRNQLRLAQLLEES
jgi:Phosphotransferase enzyme family